MSDRWCADGQTVGAYIDSKQTKSIQPGGLDDFFNRSSYTVEHYYSDMFFV